MSAFFLLFAVIVWGWSFVATKVCLEVLSPVELLGLRVFIALPILFIMARLNGAKFDRNPLVLKQLAIGTTVITAHFLIQITGLQYTSATNTGWIISITPLVTVVLSYLFLKERIGRFEIAGIFVATIGVLLLVSHGNPMNLEWLKNGGDWLILASAHTWAIYTVVTRNLTRSQPPLIVTIGVLLPAGVLMLAYMLFTSDWGSFLHMPAHVYVALLVLAVLATALAHWFWQEGVKRIGASRAGIFLFLEPIATTTLAVPYLNEQFGLFTAIGGFLVLSGVYIAQKRTKTQ
ncbi:MAG: DMT family transporter [Candidatus Zixiibacteriota bacterium]